MAKWDHSACGADSGDDDNRSGFQLLGQKVCLRSMARLLGVGSSRLARLRKAFLAGEQCPLDGRLRKASFKGKKLTQLATHKRELVHDFLNELWVEVSEPMPEVNANHGGRQQTDKTLRFRRSKGKRPRREKKRDDPLDEVNVQELRFLPPGSYTEYLALFHSKNPTVRVSLKLFTQASRCPIQERCIVIVVFSALLVHSLN